MADLRVLYEKFGQSPWLDNLSRQMLDDGTIAGLIQTGIRGLTSNPTIFEKALADSTAYDTAIAASSQKEDTTALYWELAIGDIRRTADLLRPVFDESNAADGYVSLEVSPEIAQDTQATIDQAHDLWRRVNRPNLMIKVPATKACLPAIKQLTTDGLNINITLIFGLERYQEVIEAYLSGLEARSDAIDTIHSVASFFVSRVDTEVDERLAKLGTENAKTMQGKAGLAQARLAYEIFTNTFTDQNARWQKLLSRGATAQRPLWASTSTKNPAYDSLMYVTGLLAAQTVNTMPNVTLDAIKQAVQEFQAPGITEATIHEAHEALERLDHEFGIRMPEVADLLEQQGVEKFHASFTSLLSALAAKTQQ